MKVLFAISLAAMLALSVLAVATLPERRSDVPLLYWTSDPNPARGPQIAAFERWLDESGFGEVSLKLDSNNAGVMKVIIQSASGVASDCVDVYGGGQLRQYVAAGVLMDVTDLAKQYGFDLSRTYASAEQELCVDGRQYAFPCNVSAFPITINRGTLEREGLPLPKFDWTWDEFLQWALAVRKVEDGRVTRFAVWPFGPEKLWPTNGASIFNETMTRCVLDSDRAMEATQFYYDLMFKYKAMPTPTDRASVASREGYGGAMLQWLGTDLVLGVAIGRYGLIQLRRFPDFVPDVALFPHKVMPMQMVGARAAGINAGTRNIEYAARFLQFLASPTYNRIIIEDADALPPNPALAEADEFVHPSKWPREHGAHEKYARAARDYGVGAEFSPFVNPDVVRRVIAKYSSGLDSAVISVEQAHRDMTGEINRELANTVARDRRLSARYEKAMATQAEIDRLKSEGRPVPLELIANPILRHLREAGK
ncbi:MAG TPA: extracellular solute-binding protein [Planctomycetota bacterium]|nr:extracellular solute-binding protein [Planctomycetota bacterium]